MHLIFLNYNNLRITIKYTRQIKIMGKSNKQKLTKSDLVILSKYEKVFEMAENNYLNGVYNADVNAVEPIYNKLGYHLTAKACGGCILNMFRTLGKIYKIENERRNSK